MSRFLRLYILLAVGLLATLAITALVGGLGSVRADTSGPNASGYVWIDNNAPDPVITFDFIDATGGTALGPSDDESDTVALPFTFNFFGTDYTELDISSNGFLSFDIGNDCNDNYNDVENTIPADDANCEDSPNSGWGGNPLIAPWFDDLDPNRCGDVYYETFGSEPNRTFVVQFDDVCHNICSDCSAGEGITYETILFEGSNDIKVQYMDTFFSTRSSDISEQNLGASATTGINKDGTTGLQYSFNQTILTDGLAVLYTTNFGEPTNITLDPPTASNEIGSDHTVTATVTDGLGFPIEEADVAFEVTDGPNVGDNNGQGTDLDASGQADFTYTGDGGAGTDTIEACVVDFPVCATATKDWVEPPTPTPTPSPTPTAVAEVVQLPTTGGTPSDGGSSTLTWLAAIAGAIALIGSGSAWFAYQRRRIR